MDSRAAHGAYMDYQASTPTDPRVVAAMRPFVEGHGFGNPHAVDHRYGWDAAAAIDEARRQVAEAIKADSDEIVFTSGATEANNLALIGSARAAPPDRREVIVSAIEHKCVLAAARALEADGFKVRLAPVGSDGVVILDSLASMITPGVAVVSIMAVNNETGVRQPVEAVGRLCRAADALFHCDAAQALSTTSIDVDAWSVDLMSLSAHKAYGPKGVGALFVRRTQRQRIKPIFFGGGQEDGLRPGTLPTPLCVGFGAACAILEHDLANDGPRVAALRDRLHDLIVSRLPAVRVNGALENRHHGNLNLHFPGVEGEMLLAAARPRLAAATGSACTSGLPEPSHVLIAMGLSAQAATESIRLSLGRFSTEDDVDAAADALVGAAEEVGLIDKV